MPQPKFSEDIRKNIVGNIDYRGTIKNGEIMTDNEDGTYDVKISLSDKTYPSVETITYEMDFAVGEIAVLSFEYGCKEIPKILGHGKKIAQDPVEIEVDYSGSARVVTLDAYTITTTTAYLEARIYISGGAGNCTRRGFQYGTTTAYDDDTHTDSSYSAGSYAIQAMGLSAATTYHFRAYIVDENGDTQYGGDKTFTTAEAIVIGNPAVVGNGGCAAGKTLVDINNPANVSGTVTSVDIWTLNGASNVEVGIFYTTSTGNDLSTRSTVSLGSVGGGNTQHVVSLEVVAGDYIGWYCTAGSLRKTSGTFIYRMLYKSGDNIPCTNAEFANYGYDYMSLYGE